MSQDFLSPSPLLRAASLLPALISEIWEPFGETITEERDDSGFEPGPSPVVSSDHAQFVGDLANMVQVLQSAIRILTACNHPKESDALSRDVNNALLRAQATFDHLRGSQPGA